ncbi:unnamed protein product [Cuscuta campestris]|uniref:Uncharacterized protein n=1 Tax=Cuscuta campestris TaxID=132261 RepID=A0A484KVR3_9ASTE|nr:unnamed protein product [Cuscuta campestris]
MEPFSLRCFLPLRYQRARRCRCNWCNSPSRCSQSEITNAACWAERSFDWNGKTLCSCGKRGRVQILVSGTVTCNDEVNCLWRPPFELI